MLCCASANAIAIAITITITILYANTYYSTYTRRCAQILRTSSTHSFHSVCYTYKKPKLDFYLIELRIFCSIFHFLLTFRSEKMSNCYTDVTAAYVLYCVI